VNENAILDKFKDEQIMDLNTQNQDQLVYKRRSFLRKQDVANMKRKLGINTPGLLHRNDEKSVINWAVEEAAKGSESSLLYYKPPGVVDSYGVLDDEDIFLAIMSPVQVQMALKNLSLPDKIVCMDSTHGLNQYSFLMISLLTIDSFGKGYPVAHLYSNKETKKVLKLFLKLIKNKCGQLDCDAFMSDCAATFYNAWIEEMCVNKPLPARLWCSWHVLKNWTKKLKKIPDNLLQKKVTRKLLALRDELDEEKFPHMLNSFIEFCKKHCPVFCGYFEKYYYKIPQRWAYCYRKKFRINTNMMIENLHRTIKKLYFGGKAVRRLDQSLHTLLKVIKDRQANYICLREMGYSTARSTSIAKNHRKAMDICKTVILESDNGDFLCTVNSDQFKLTRNYDQPHECYQDCSICQLCVHQYTCSCKEYVVKSEFCSHIHLISILKMDFFKMDFLQNFNANTISIHPQFSSFMPSLTTSNSLLSSIHHDHCYSKLQVNEHINHEPSRLNTVVINNLEEKANDKQDSEYLSELDSINHDFFNYEDTAEEDVNENLSLKLKKKAEELI
jgi:hypothetical protein